MELFHQADDVSNVLNDVNGPHFAERIVAKRKRDMVEVGDHIGGGVRISIQADRAGIFLDAAADI